MSEGKIIRVFPRRTKATPDDPLAFVGDPGLFLPMADEVHVSVTFTWDIAEGHRLAHAWAEHYSDVSIGGPALGDAGDEFISGRYLQPGYVMTSRGCPNTCKGCYVPKREGPLRLLPIVEGHDVCDNNLLACPRDHIESVLEMLKRQKEPARFTGGLEASRVDEWFVRQLVGMRLDVAHLAYDRPSQRAHVERAAGLFRDLSKWVPGTLRRKIGCYVLCGYPNDRIEEAVKRFEWVASLGIRPYPMFLRLDGDEAKTPREWGQVIRPYMRPHIAYHTERNES